MPARCVCTSIVYNARSALWTAIYITGKILKLYGCQDFLRYEHILSMNQTNDIQQLPYLQSLNACLEGSFNTGYTERFIAKKTGYVSAETHKMYPHRQIRIISKMHFEGNKQSEIADIILIETDDGRKGIVDRRIDNW